MSDSEIKVGKELLNKVWDSKKTYHTLFSDMEDEITILNRKTSDIARNLYDSVITKLKVNDDGHIKNNEYNLNKVNYLMGKLSTIQKDYRKRYGSLVRGLRKDSTDLMKDEYEKQQIILNKIGIKVPDFHISDKAKEFGNRIHQIEFRNINVILTKWKNFVYDNFINAILMSNKTDYFINSFFGENGTIRIGSSLDQATIYEAMTAITRERTAYHRDMARESKMTSCWNANPMDRRTKPICMSASLAGVISENEMSTAYSFPPRHICRCEIVYTRDEWIDVNKGINEGIEERRIKLIEESNGWPKKKPFWYNSKGTKIIPSDSDVRKNEMYKRDKKLLEVAKKNIVPKYTGGI